MIDSVNRFAEAVRMTGQRSDLHLHQRLGWRVSRLARILQSRLEAVLAADGLTRLMWVVLCGIGEDGIETPSDMAAYIGITRASTSRLLTTMAARGLIERRGTQGGDGRQVVLALTAHGQDILIRHRPAADAISAHFLAKLTPDQSRILMEALQILASGEADDLTRL